MEINIVDGDLLGLDAYQNLSFFQKKAPPTCRVGGAFALQ